MRLPPKKIKPGHIHYMTNIQPNQVFVYGTLRDARTREYVLEHIDRAYPNHLYGYKLVTYKTPEGDHYADIEEHKHGMVVGDIFQVTDEDMAKLIAWEDEYVTKEVTLADGTKAVVFILKDENKLKEE